MSQRPYITCRQLIDFIADYLDGLLEATAKEDFDRHMAVCDSCVAYLASYEETIRAARLAEDAAAQSVADAAPDELVEAILKNAKR